MDNDVKRPYVSALRTRQAAETRRTVVSAAAELFVAQGFGRTTIEAVAATAGVGRNTVFALGGKLDLLKLALDWAVVGDEEPIPLAERPEVQEIAKASDPDLIIKGWVTVVTGVSSRLAALSGVLLEAAGGDDAARALWQTSQSQRLFGARAFVAHLVNHGGLRADVTPAEAADLAWLHSDPAMYRRLVLDRGWTPDRFARWLLETMSLALRGDAGHHAI